MRGLWLIACLVLSQPGMAASTRPQVTTRSKVQAKPPVHKLKPTQKRGVVDASQPRGKRSALAPPRHARASDVDNDDQDNASPADLTRTLKRLTRTQKVVLDAGHGGHDSGAHGVGGVIEKSVTLAVTLEVSRLLDAAGLNVVLTRGDDTYLTLQARTDLANKHDADVFVSIHANSAPRRTASGVETYYLNVTSDRYAMRLAAVENNTSEKEVGDLQLILADLSTKANTPDSVRLANLVQRSIVTNVRPVNADIESIGVKSALFYVLLGARMPAILVELGFLSNPQEARLLGSSAYQHVLSRAIADAIIEHLQTPMSVVTP